MLFTSFAGCDENGLDFDFYWLIQLYEVGGLSPFLKGTISLGVFVSGAGHWQNKACGETSPKDLLPLQP